MFNGLKIDDMTETKLIWLHLSNVLMMPANATLASKRFLVEGAYFCKSSNCACHGHI